jgi:hypothetical protein
MKIDELLKKINRIRVALGYEKYLFTKPELLAIFKYLKKPGQRTGTGCFTFTLSKTGRNIIIKPDFGYHYKLK